jgi:hypothetical protein
MGRKTSSRLSRSDSHARAKLLARPYARYSRFAGGSYAMYRFRLSQEAMGWPECVLHIREVRSACYTTFNGDHRTSGVRCLALLHAGWTASVRVDAGTLRQRHQILPCYAAHEARPKGTARFDCLMAHERLHRIRRLNAPHAGYTGCPPYGRNVHAASQRLFIAFKACCSEPARNTLRHLYHPPFPPPCLVGGLR